MRHIGKKLFCYFLISLAVFANSSMASELLILRGNEDYPPDELHINGELTGFHIELIRNVAQLIPLSIKFENIPWKRAVQMLKNGEGDALTYVSKNTNREKYALFLNDNILSESHYHLIINNARKEEIKYDGNIKTLAKYTIGIQRGYVYSEEFDQAIFKNRVEFNSVRQMTSLVSANRIDLAILTMEEFQAQKDTISFKDVTILSPALISSASYLAFSKKRNQKKTAELFAKTMKAYKKTIAYQALRKKYNK